MILHLSVGVPLPFDNGELPRRVFERGPHEKKPGDPSLPRGANAGNWGCSLAGARGGDGLSTEDRGAKWSSIRSGLISMVPKYWENCCEENHTHTIVDGNKF